MMKTRAKMSSKDRKSKLIPLYSCLSMYKAIALVILGSFLMSINGLVVKSTTTLSAAELGFIKELGVFVLNLPFALCGEKRQFFNKATLLTLILRGVFGSVSLYLAYVAIRLMPLAESSVIMSTTPVWVMILSRIFLKEKFDILNTLSIVLSVAGLVLMSRVFVFIFSSPGERYLDWNYWIGCLLSLVSALTGAITFVFIRKLRDIHESVTIAYNSTIGVIVLAIVISILREVEVPACGVGGVKMISLGVCSFLGEYCVISALRQEKAGAVSSVRTSSRVCMMFLWQTVVFGEIPDVYSVLAAIVILASLWLSVLRKYRQQKRRKSEAKTITGATENEESLL